MYCTEILLDFLSSASQLRNLRVNSQTFSRLRILLAYSHEISKTRHSKTTPTVSLLWNSRRWRHCPCPWTKNVHGCTDKKLIERQTTKMSTEERRHGDTETRRHVHINRVESSYGTKAPRGDKSYGHIIDVKYKDSGRSAFCTGEHTPVALKFKLANLDKNKHEPLPCPANPI